MMSNPTKWDILILPSVKRKIKKLDKPVQKEIDKFLRETLAVCDDPSVHGKLLVGNLQGIYSFRVIKDYRILCKIEDHKLIITVVRADHRKDVYKPHG